MSSPNLSEYSNHKLFEFINKEETSQSQSDKNRMKKSSTSYCNLRNNFNDKNKTIQNKVQKNKSLENFVTVTLSRRSDPPALITEDPSDFSSAYPNSSILSSKVFESTTACSDKIAASVISSLLANITSSKSITSIRDDEVNNVSTSDISTTDLDFQITVAAENIKKHMLTTELDQRINIVPEVTSTSNFEDLTVIQKNGFPIKVKTINPCEPSTSRFEDYVHHKYDESPVSLNSSEVSLTLSSDSSSYNSPRQKKSKGSIHRSLVEALSKTTTTTAHNYYSNQDLNSSKEVAYIDDNLKQNEYLSRTNILDGSRNSSSASTICSGEITENFTEISDESPTGSMIAVLDFDVNEWRGSSETETKTTASTSKN